VQTFAFSESLRFSGRRTAEFEKHELCATYPPQTGSWNCKLETANPQPGTGPHQFPISIFQFRISSFELRLRERRHTRFSGRSSKAAALLWNCSSDRG